MPIKESLQNLARKICGIPEKEVSGEGYARPVAAEMREYDKESLRNDRQSKITDCQKMDAIDPRVSRILRKLASDAAVGKFHLTIEQAPTEANKEKAQAVIDDIINRCNINRKLKGWIKSCLKEGDLFLEVITSNDEIVRLKKLASIITFSNLNSEGNFPEGEPAYYQEHPLTREKVKTFEAWQIIHIKWDEEDGIPYGTPLMSSARLPWKRLDNAEKNVVVRRATRAGNRRLHNVGTKEDPGSWEAVEEYKRRNRDTLDNPLEAVQDFFGDGRISIDNIQGDDTIAQFDDISHFEGLLSLNAGVPMALLSGGREENINRDVLDEQEEDYFRVVQDINETFEYGLRQAFDLALLLAGINDASIEYTFNWGAKDRDDVDAKIKRALDLQQLGFSFETIVSVCDLDAIDFEIELERIRSQVAEGTVPYGIGIQPKLYSPYPLLGLPGQTNEQVLEQLQKLRENVESHLNGKIIPLKVAK